MGLKRSEARKLCMTILYQLDIYRERNLNIDVEKVIKENTPIKNTFVDDVVHGVINNINEIDDIANNKMNDWTINRIDKIGAAIMRIAIYEIKYTDTPDIVAINEAVELAKEYSDENVKKIINAVLDKVISD